VSDRSFSAHQRIDPGPRQRTKGRHTMPGPALRFSPVKNHGAQFNALERSAHRAAGRIG